MNILTRNIRVLGKVATKKNVPVLSYTSRRSCSSGRRFSGGEEGSGGWSYKGGIIFAGMAACVTVSFLYGKRASAEAQTLQQPVSHEQVNTPKIDLPPPETEEGTKNEDGIKTESERVGGDENKKEGESEEVVSVEDDIEDDGIFGRRFKDTVQFKYVIVGTGAAGFSALSYILKTDDSDAKVHCTPLLQSICEKMRPKVYLEILFVGKEPSLPYNRPPLSKNLWKSDDPDVAEKLTFKDWEGNAQNLFFEHAEYFKNNRVTYMPGRKVIDLDVFSKALLIDDGTVVEFDKCLLAIGGAPRQLPALHGVPHVSTFRTVEDFQALHKLSQSAKHITIVGGGFLGSELAWSVSRRGVKVTQVFPETGVLATILPKYLSDFVTGKAREAGIDIHTDRLVSKVTLNDDNENLIVTLDNGDRIDTEHVGLVPSTEFVRYDLEIDPTNGGIVVNPELEARTDVYVAGDAASFYDRTLGVRRRIEHYDHSLATGRLAAENMVFGSHKAYLYQPMFWSDLGDHGFEAVGITDSKLQTVGIWETPKEQPDNNGEPKPDYNRGIIYYLKDEVVVGVITWGVFGKLDAARVALRNKVRIEDAAILKNYISLEHEEKAEHSDTETPADH